MPVCVPRVRGNQAPSGLEIVLTLNYGPPTGEERQAEPGGHAPGRLWEKRSLVGTVWGSAAARLLGSAHAQGRPK